MVRRFTPLPILVLLLLHLIGLLIPPRNMYSLVEVERVVQMITDLEAVLVDIEQEQHLSLDRLHKPLS